MKLLLSKVKKRIDNSKKRVYKCPNKNKIFCYNPNKIFLLKKIQTNFILSIVTFCRGGEMLNIF